nr:MAG TPA: Cell Wall Hydrolase [Caudoviricetes sp.]
MRNLKCILLVAFIMVLNIIPTNHVNADEIHLTAGVSSAVMDILTNSAIDIVEEEVSIETAYDYTQEDLELLAHVIYAEAGSDYCTDEMRYGVGSVVLNRVEDECFPDTLYNVIYQKGQYQCTWDGNINKTPDKRAYRIAMDLLNNGSIFPSDVVYQAEFKQGSGVYSKIQNIYFCHK